ncbi:MAG: SH3 domain-containing protein [Verrucomicrobia bacterium]|nr:SH3 domain-containing protein [Verrucomicrobiota bacterium]
MIFPAALLLAAATAARAAEEPAVVKNNRVNIRGQPTLKSEVVTQLKKGEPITILEEIADPKAKKSEPPQWLRIALPTNTPVWVNALFVANNIVLPNKLNVRAGPGESFSTLTRLEKGATVKPIRTFEGWIEIEAPASASAFVAADQVTRNAPAPAVAATKPPAPAPTPEPPKVETVKVDQHSRMRRKKAFGIGSRAGRRRKRRHRRLKNRNPRRRPKTSSRCPSASSPAKASCGAR